MNTAQLREHYQSFDNEGLLELHQSGKLADAAYPIIEAEMFSRNIAYPDRPKDWEPPAAPPFISSYWNGERSLGRAFWLVWLIGHKALFFAVYMSALALQTYIPGTERFSLILFSAYLVFAVVSVWRCGNNTSWSGWAWISRVITLAYSGIMIYGIGLIMAR